MTLLGTAEAAKYLSLSKTTLRCWRAQKKGPKYIKFNSRSIKYSIKELDKFIESKTIKYTYNPDETEADNEYISNK